MDASPATAAAGARPRLGDATGYEILVGFFHAVDWSEKWIWCLILLHLFIVLGVWLTRTKANTQIAFFLVLRKLISLTILFALLNVARW